MSMTGNLARRTGCCGTTSVERGLYSRIFGSRNSEPDAWAEGAWIWRDWPDGPCGCCAVTLRTDSTTASRRGPGSWRRFMNVPGRRISCSVAANTVLLWLAEGHAVDQPD